uniref:non-specific serine/threonine protein kinase n=1 Tax=Fagus sylvatica TaxID=28930 RepID=A0A2N9HW38_FAGSY
MSIFNFVLNRKPKRSRTRNQWVLSSMFLIPNLLFFFFETTYGVDSITPSQSLTDGNTLVSKEGNFELGFFSPGSSNNRYLGIWYKNIPVKTIVWVANRDSPIDNSSGILMINSTGTLVLLSQNKSVVWSTSSLKQAQTPLLQLLDTGNLVLTDEKNGVKLGWDLKRGLNRRLIAWKNWDDPSSGDLIIEMTLHNYPEVYLFQGTVKYYRIGPWNGLGFSGALPGIKNHVFNFTFVHNQDELSLQTTVTVMAFVEPMEYVPMSFPVCQCLKGFKPKSQQKWDSMDWSQGCVRNKPLNCQEIITHGFVKFPNLKVPDTTYTWVNTSMNLKECREKCLSNCSCTAYTNSDIKEGIGCAIWFGDLLDIKQFPDGGQDLYIRMHPSELGMENGHKKNIAAIVACSIVVVSGMLLGSYYVCSKENLRGIMERIRTIVHSSNSKGPEEDMELPLFDLSTIARATDDFSLNNKLGEGGFGPVYKGTLLQGKDIAVKRLSKTSGQGLNEFKNEVNLIAKLQHRNLVKLLGSCIQGK